MAETTDSTPPEGNPSQFGVERPATILANGNGKHGEVTPNTGASIPDNQRKEDERTAVLAEWRKQNGIDITKHIKLVKVSHMRYQHPDIPTITKFLKDFGMHVVKQDEDEKLWFRGYGSDQYVYYCQKGPEKKFLGGTFEVESYGDLEKAEKLPGAGKIEEMKDAPGGGYLLTVLDPAGFPVNLMYGQQPASRDEQYPGKLLQNYEVEKPRVRKFNRFTPGPAAVHKLGHYGYCVENFDEQLKFYTHNFNFAPTDFLTAPVDGQTKDVAVFMHVDREDQPTDHHTLFMATNPTTHVHHASFEVHDFDTQQLGHQWLASQKYDSVWGVGRHILGSQIFDYWWDTTGFMIEHYADGDLVNKDTPIGWMDAGDESLAVWGKRSPTPLWTATTTRNIC